MNIHVLRLAIMAHLLSEHWNEPVVTGECLEYAIRIADYFTQIHVKIKSQNALAEVLGVSQQYVNKILKEQ